MKRIPLVAFILGLGVSMSAFAHDVDMAQKVREFGVSVGNAYVCIATKTGLHSRLNPNSFTR